MVIVEGFEIHENALRDARLLQVCTKYSPVLFRRALGGSGEMNQGMVSGTPSVDFPARQFPFQACGLHEQFAARHLLVSRLHCEQLVQCGKGVGVEIVVNKRVQDISDRLAVIR